MPLLLISHAHCPDGAAAAWAAYHRHPDVEVFFTTYGPENTPPDVTDRDVVITDFCYPRDVLLKMKSKARSLVVLDHHVTMQKQCGDLEFCHFDMNKSGAMLSWEYFNPHDKPPHLITCIQYRDLGYLFTRPESEHPQYAAEILAAIDSYPRTFETWDDLVWKCQPGHWDRVVTEGEAILRYKNKLIESLLKRTHEIEINGMKVKAINSPVLQSELGTRLAEENDFGVVWYQASDTEVRFSLRSLDSKEDVSKIAESFPPGGGHRCASGFALKENLLKGKIK